MKPRANGEPASPTLNDLLDFAAEVNLAEVVWEKEGRRMAFKRSVSFAPPPAPASPAEAPAGSVVAPDAHHQKIKSPMVGTFLRAPKDRPPLVVEGDVVTPGQRLAIVEAMQVPKDVMANVKGRILRVLVENGRPVEYGQPLFEIDPSEGT
jgi:biotin carboxyl carrier protein